MSNYYATQVAQTLAEATQKQVCSFWDTLEPGTDWNCTLPTLHVQLPSSKLTLSVLSTWLEEFMAIVSNGYNTKNKIESSWFLYDSY